MLRGRKETTDEEGEASTGHAQSPPAWDEEWPEQLGKAKVFSRCDQDRNQGRGFPCDLSLE
jgi:hypothetical protein